MDGSKCFPYVREYPDIQFYHLVNDRLILIFDVPIIMSNHILTPLVQNFVMAASLVSEYYVVIGNMCKFVE